ncbi:MAG TPA: hypothetical protein VF278_13335 [Pirellulales bacterium]
MRRLLVRASALTGLLLVAIFTLVQAHRTPASAMAQERQPPPARTKKKTKPKATAKKPAAPAPARDRYADRYAPRPSDADENGAARVVVDFDDEVPEAGPDLFPQGAAPATARAAAPAAGDPFSRPLTDEPPNSIQEEAVETADARPVRGYAPGSTSRAKSSAAGKPAAVAAKKRPPRTIAPAARAGAIPVDRHAQPAADVFGPEPEPQPPRRSSGPNPRSDPFGDGGRAGGGPQAVVGQGRPGMKQLEGPQAPSLVVEKAAPDEIQIGKPAIFAVRVQNVGTVAAQGVEIQDVIPQGTHLMDARPAAEIVDGKVTWRVGTVKAGEETVVEMELMPVAEGEIGSVATVHFSGEASARTRCTRPQLAVDVSAPEQVLIGEEVMFSIKVSNPGTGTATGVVISDAIPEQLEHPAGSELEYEVGDLKPGESRQVDLSMGAMKAGQVINTIMASADGQLQAEQRSEVMIVAPQLEVSMQGPKRRFLERQATYTVVVSNPGTAPAKEVRLVTHLPKGLKFVAANNSGEFDAETNTVHWTLEELPAKETGQVTLTTLPIEAGEQLLKVEGVAERGLAAEQEEVVSVEGVAAILFQLADLADPIEVGGETTYEIRVVNQGSKAATNIELLATFPPQIKPRSAHGPTRDSVSGQEVRFAPLGRLPPKGETTYQIRAQGIAAGDLRVQVQLVTDEMQSPVTKEESTRVYADE